MSDGRPPCVPSLADRLAEAQLALHRLNIGQQYQRVTLESGRTVEFTPAKIDMLQAYVDDLQAQMNNQPTRGALGFIF